MREERGVEIIIKECGVSCVLCVVEVGKSGSNMWGGEELLTCWHQRSGARIMTDWCGEIADVAEVYRKLWGEGWMIS